VLAGLSSQTGTDGDNEPACQKILALRIAQHSLFLCQLALSIEAACSIGSESGE
jgi:hypothetical protein